MTGVHRIRLRGPWQVEPLSRLRQHADGTVIEQTSSLPPGGVTTTPFDCRQIPLGDDDAGGRVRYRRRFGRPTHLGADECVLLVVPPLTAPADVRINGTLLGQVEPHGGAGRFDITGRLKNRNELWIDLLRQPGEQAPAPDLSESATDVVCLEIGPRAGSDPKACQVGR